MIFQKSIVIFLLSIFLSFTISAQDIDLNRMSEEQIFDRMDTSLENMLGDACGVGGYPSEPVIWMTECIRASKINLIRSLLYSKNPSVQFLACTLCEVLEQEGLMSLSTIEKKTINGIKKLDTKVHTCSGCTHSGLIPISSMYNCKNDTCVVVSDWVRMWASSEVKEYQHRKKMDEKVFSYLQDSIQNAIGYGFRDAVVMTQSVALIEGLMDDSKVGLIRTLLYSSNPSVQFLSALLCENLQEEKLIIMTKEEKKEITAIRNSKAHTKLCSGCIYREASLNQLWLSENKEILKFRKWIKAWVSQQVKEYKKVAKKK